MDPRDYPIQVRISRSKTFQLSHYVLREHLPYLPLAEIIYPQDFLPRGNKYMTTALLYLFDHLSEISRDSTSAALLDSLEASFRREARRHGVATVHIFSCLGHILQPKCFASSCELFSALSTFFTRNLEKIIHGHPGSIVCYVRALNIMKWPMTEVLACVATHPTITDRLLFRSAWATEEDSPILDPEAIEELLMMREQKRRRMQREGGALTPMGHGGRGGNGIKRMGGRGRGGHLSFVRGDHLEEDELLFECHRRPENVFVRVDGQGGGCRAMHRHRLPLDDYDSDDSIDDELGWGHFGPGPRRGRKMPHGRRREGVFGRRMAHPMLIGG